MKDPSATVDEPARGTTGAALDTVSGAVETVTSDMPGVAPPHVSDAPLVTVTVTIPGVSLP